MEQHLYLVRHGQTLFNRKGIIQGRCDSPLTELGREQAGRAGAYLRWTGLAFDHAYASPSGRTRETMECITDMPYSCEQDLREFDFGSFEGEHETVLVRPFSLDMFVPFGGESSRQLSDRMNRVLTDIMSRPEHERVLVVTHGTASQVFLDRWSSYRACNFTGLPGNCAIMYLTYDGEVFSLQSVVQQEDMVG